VKRNQKEAGGNRTETSYKAGICVGDVAKETKAQYGTEYYYINEKAR